LAVGRDYWLSQQSLGRFGLFVTAKRQSIAAIPEFCLPQAARHTQHPLLFDVPCPCGKQRSHFSRLLWDVKPDMSAPRIAKIIAQGFEPKKNTY
jgi:hypothetical protein